MNPMNVINPINPPSPVSIKTYRCNLIYDFCFQESDISTSKLLRRVDGRYNFDAEVTAQFSDFSKCQSVCNFLVEKLDENVRVSLPEFYQSPQRLENLR